MNLSRKSCKLSPIKATVAHGSKRARKSPEKIKVSQEDLAELSNTAKPDIDTSVSEENISEEGDVSLDDVVESEDVATQENSEDTEPSNS